jgi:hypothetical protein
LKSASGYQRIDRGKGHSYKDPDGDKLDGVTTIIGDGVPKPALVDWAAKSVAAWLGDFYEDLADLTPSQRTKRAVDAFNADRFKPAARGRIIHDHAAELLWNTENVAIDEADLPIVDTFLRFADEWHLDPVAVEAPVVSVAFRYMGTIDCLGLVGTPGRMALLDWKTGASGVFPEAALQLAAYAHADFYIDTKGGEHAMPNIDLAAAVWLQDDRYEVKPVDIGEATFGAFLCAQEVAHFTRRPRNEVVLDAVKP